MRVNNGPQQSGSAAGVADDEQEAIQLIETGHGIHKERTATCRIKVSFNGLILNMSGCNLRDGFWQQASGGLKNNGK